MLRVPGQATEDNRPQMECDCRFPAASQGDRKTAEPRGKPGGTSLAR